MRLWPGPNNKSAGEREYVRLGDTVAAFAMLAILLTYCTTLNWDAVVVVVVARELQCQLTEVQR